MLERILEFSVRRRYLIMVLSLIVAAIGLYALQRLPIDAVPDITNNQVQITTVAPALSPTEVEKQVTFTVEDALAGIPGLQYTRSLSRNGFSQVTAVFSDGVDIYFARQQISERIAGARESLPPNIEPKMGAIATGLGEVYTWAVEFSDKGVVSDSDKGFGWQHDGTFVTPDGQKLASELERATYLRTVQDWIIRPQMKGLSGLAGIDTIGGYVKQYVVEPDPTKLAAYGLSFQEIIDALERNNVSTGAGYVEHNGEAYLVRADSRVENVRDLEKIAVTLSPGERILMKDVARVHVGAEVRTGSASKNGKEVVLGTAIMLIGENSRVIAESVDEKLRSIVKTLPPGITATPVLNRTKLVDATIHTVQSNLIEGAILVIVVLFALLGNFRAALITAMAIPLSMLMMATGMVGNKISGNLMSLGAIDFGLIVDGAVIIVENCLRRLAIKGHAVGRGLSSEERLEEIIISTKEMIQPSIYGQGIIITSYLPILALSGIEGKMFRPMGMTVIIALVSAFILSITFIPAMLGIFIKGDVKEHDNAIVRSVKDVYEKTLRGAMTQKKAVVGGAIAFFAFAVLCFFYLGQEFIPRLDEQDLAVETRRLLSMGITESTKMQLEIEKGVSVIPEVAFVFSKLGTAEMASDPVPPSGADTYIVFKPRSAWPNPKISKDDVVHRIKATLTRFPGSSFEFSQPIEMRFNELIAGVRSDVAVKVFGEDFGQMRSTAKDISDAIEKINGASDVKVEQTTGFPTMNIAIDRDALASYGFSAADINDAVSIAIGGKKAGLVFEADKRFDLMVRLSEDVTRNPKTLSSIPLRVPGAENVPLNEMTTRSKRIEPETPPFVPLGELARIELTEGLNQVSRENGKRRVVMQANVRGRDLGSFVAEAQSKVAAKVKLRPGQWLEWGGQFENLVAARKRLMLVVPACFLLIFSILYAAFNAPRYALLVFSGIPLALTGGIGALWLRGMPFSVTAAVGFIALSGVAVLNGLVMVSFINQLRREGRELEDAIFEGSLARLRPVLMTAMVASLGFVPMALATGTGAEVQKPLATVVIGGLISSTLLTLVVLPVLYYLIESKRIGFGKGIKP